MFSGSAERKPEPKPELSGKTALKQVGYVLFSLGISVLCITGAVGVAAAVFNNVQANALGTFSIVTFCIGSAMAARKTVCGVVHSLLFSDEELRTMSKSLRTP